MAAQERQNKLTAVANERSRAIAAARQQSEEDEEARLNAEWKAILDKQEADRAMRLEELKKRIAAQQRAYESGAGAQDRDRMRKEEEARERWHKEFEERTAAEEKAKTQRLRKMQEDCDALQVCPTAAHTPAPPAPATPHARPRSEPDFPRLPSRCSASRSTSSSGGASSGARRTAPTRDTSRARRRRRERRRRKTARRSAPTR